ncbi:MAG: OmpA family protein [Bacteroidales bacterium]|nr:OmpA family protein [Bacteroidales bacterium]
MKKILLLILTLAVVFANTDAQTTKKKKKPAAKPAESEKPFELPLPPRSADCFFAVNLPLDSAFGPTEPLQGFGYVNEVHRDAQTKNVFDGEHNTVWYKIDCPYAGKLIIDIIPKSEMDDYDFLVYKYTDKYFCNRVEKNRVKPIRSIMSAPNGNLKGVTGLSLKGAAANLGKESTEAYGRFIEVQQGDSYIVVLDNLQDGGLGHTIKAEIYTEHTPLYIQVLDSLAKQRTTANIRIKDTDNDREVLNLTDVGNTKIKLLPHKSYDIFITKQGYFNYYRRVSYDEMTGRKDSVLSVRLAEIKIGSVMQIKGDVYFDIDENDSVSVLPDSYSVLDDIVKNLNEYPHMNIDIIGRISTDGMNLTKDTENSKKRADAIKTYLVSKGINEDRIFTRGSTKKELNAQIAEQNKKNRTLFPSCEIRIKSLK